MYYIAQRYSFLTSKTLQEFLNLLIKGEKLSYFGTTKGLDTLSPFLFIICVKRFSNIVLNIMLCDSTFLQNWFQLNALYHHH